MQAQTTRTFNRNVQKLAGGLLIAAALAAGAVGLTTVGDVEIPGIGSNSASVTTPAAERHFAPYFGEGLPRIDEASAVAAEHVHTSRQIAAPQGEGYPLSREISQVMAQPAGQISQMRQFDAPQGEGLPLSVVEQSDPSFDPQGEGLVMGGGQ